MDHLPVEIVLHILTFLPFADLMCVSRVNKRLCDLAGDPCNLRHLDLRQAYRCSQEDLKTFLCSPKRCYAVHNLNMDAVYWFRPPFAAIIKMKNLESLHLRGINLTFRQLHGLLTAGLQLRELTVDWPTCRLQPITMIEEMQEGVSHLKFLCLTCQTITDVIAFLKQCLEPIRLLLFCKKLKQYSPLRSRCDTIFDPKPSNVSTLQSSNCELLWKDWIKEQDDSMDTSNTSNINKTTEIVCTSLRRRLTLQQPMLHLKALQVLDTKAQFVDLHVVSEAAPNLERLRLDIHHFEGELTGYFHSICTFHCLTHLSLPIYIFLGTTGSNMTCATPPVPIDVFSQRFKRPRLGVSSRSNNEAETGALNLIVDSCPLLLMLEIGLEENLTTIKSQLEAPLHWHSLRSIRKLKRLTHLTLCNIPVTNGHFLYEIAVGCQKLTFLRLSNLGPSGKCCYLKDLINSVVHMECLIHLRVHQPYLAPGTALFTALKRCQALQRLSITSTRDMLPLDLSSLEELVKTNPSLIFVAIESKSTSKVACKEFTRNLKHISRPPLVVITGSKENIPLAHRDMVSLDSWLAGSYSGSSYHLDLPFRHHVLHFSGTQVQDYR